MAMPMKCDMEEKKIKPVVKCDMEMEEEAPVCKELISDVLPGSAALCDKPDLSKQKVPEQAKISGFTIGLTSIIESQKISGLWEVASVLVQLQKAEEVIKSSLPEKIKTAAGDQALSAWATVIMLAILYKRHVADQSKWKLIANKAIGKLKALKIIYADYQADAEKLI